MSIGSSMTCASSANEEPILMLLESFMLCKKAGSIAVVTAIDPAFLHYTVGE
jgi:hypothetical protein